MRLGKRQLQELLFYMMLTRSLERTLAEMHRERRLPSPLGLCEGFSAVAVGAAFVLATRDVVSSGLPTLGAALMRGVKPDEIVAQFLGKVSGPSRGRDSLAALGSVHRGLIPAAGHAATHVSVMAGLAYSFRLAREDRIAMALVAEEAIATGDFHEGVNFAAVRKAPLVIVAAKTPSNGSRSGGSEVSRLYERMKGYGLASLPVEGGELVRVVQVVQAAAERARSGAGPTFIEASVPSVRAYAGNDDATPNAFRIDIDVGTRRASGHSQTSPSSPSSESDPALRFEKSLLQQELLGELESRRLAERVDTSVAEAVAAANAAPLPSASSDQAANELPPRILQGPAGGTS